MLCFYGYRFPEDQTVDKSTFNMKSAWENSCEKTDLWMVVLQQRYILRIDCCTGICGQKLYECDPANMYSSDLAAYEFILFSKLKLPLQGKCFWSIDAIKNIV